MRFDGPFALQHVPHMTPPPCHPSAGSVRRASRRNSNGGGPWYQRRPRRSVFWLSAALVFLFLYGQVLDRSQDVFTPRELDVVGECPPVAN